LNHRLERITKRITEYIPDFNEFIWELQDIFWYSWTTWLRVKYQMLERMIFWGWNMRHSYDFDALLCYDILYLKLKRVYECHRDHGNCVWNSNPLNRDMKRLREAVGLAKWLSVNDNSSNKNYFKLVEKYYDENGRGLLSRQVKELYPKAKPIDSKLYSFMFRKAINKDYEEYLTKKNRFFYLLNKYLGVWWD